MWRQFSDPAYLTDLIRIVWGRAKGYKLLIAGSASGELVGALRDRGIDAWGVENNRYIHGKTPKALQKYNVLGSITDLPFKADEFDFVYETSLCHVGEKQVVRAVRELNRVMKTGLVFGSVTSDMAPALIDRYDLLRGVKKLGTWWEWSELFFGNGFDLSMHRRDCTDALWAATLAADKGPGGGTPTRTSCAIPSSTRSRTTRTKTSADGLEHARAICGLRAACPSPQLLCRIHPDRIASPPLRFCLRFRLRSCRPCSIGWFHGVQTSYLRASKPPASDDPELAAKERAEEEAGRWSAAAAKRPCPTDDDEEDEDDELELDDDDDDEDLVVFTAKEAAGALSTVYAFIKPFLINYKKLLVFVSFGVLVETLFNVIMPLSLKFLIDDALGEEDFQALYKILGVLAVAGIVTSIIAVWYERWDARLAAGVIADVRARLFEHVQNLPAAYFARTKRGEILSRFSIDLAAFEGSVKTFANSAALPFLELIAGIILMLFLNWQLAAVALLVFPITLIGPRILTPKAVQANYEQKLNESSLLGMVQENVAAQAVVKAFSLQRRTLGWFTMRNQDVRIKTASAVFLSTMVERTVTISVLLLHLVVLAIGAYLATKGQITIGTFVTFESAFWEVSYNIAHLMHFIPVSIQAAAAVRHIQELLDEPTRGADRPGAPDLPRVTNDITFDRVTFGYEGTRRRYSTISASSSMSARASRSSVPAVPARARCSI